MRDFTTGAHNAGRNDVLTINGRGSSGDGYEGATLAEKGSDGFGDGMTFMGAAALGLEFRAEARQSVQKCVPCLVEETLPATGDACADNPDPMVLERLQREWRIFPRFIEC